MRSPRELQLDARMLLSRRLNTSLAPPDRVTVNLTLRCNLACTMCTTCYDSPELSTEEVKAIIDQTAAWGVPVFNPLGGEPFMRADIEELLAYAVRRGFYVTVTSNGTLITERRAGAIASIPADKLHMVFSIDGLEEAHDRVRGTGMYRRALEGYRRVRAADARLGNSRRKILANCLLHAGNIDQYLDLLTELEHLGFDGVQVLHLFRPSPGASPEHRAMAFGPDHRPALEQLAEALVRRTEQQDERGLKIQNSPKELRMIPRWSLGELEPLEAPCWAGWKELYINADGAAIMCDGKLDFLAGTFGSVRESTLQQLWASPRLAERRAVVKACTTPCIQTCYLRGSSDSAPELVRDALALGIAKVSRVGRSLTLPGRRERVPESVLRLELTDVCPCDWEGCPTPPRFYQDLVRGVPRLPSSESWGELRDRGHLNFGRGFMGFDVLRSICNDLMDGGLQFETLALRWRGEPLLHPEIEPILRYLYPLIGPEGVAQRLRMETCGRFLTPKLALFAGQPTPQEWILDLGRGEGAGLAQLLAARGPHTRLIYALPPGADLSGWLRRLPPVARVAGRLPDGHEDLLWLKRQDHNHYLANQRARQELVDAATQLGLEVDAGEEDRPRRCLAPARSPTVSWDGKLTLCPTDRTLQLKIGELTPGSLSRLWRGALRTRAAEEARRQGVPAQGLCRSCPAPWSPNQDGTPPEGPIRS